MGRGNKKTIPESTEKQDTVEKLIDENGVQVVLKGNHDNPSSCNTFFNTKMKTNREFVLMCLKAHCGFMKDDQQNYKVKCLDAFGATGICGMQWVKHCGDDVEVTINDIDTAAHSNITRNCRLNHINIVKELDPESEPTAQIGGDVMQEGCTKIEATMKSRSYSPRRLKGETICENVTDQEDRRKNTESMDCSHSEEQARLSVEIEMKDANVLMHSRQFHFIHLDPYGTTVQFLEAAFRNVYHRGVVVLTSTDVASLYGKCPQVTNRNYSAHSVRCDYQRELAARIILATAARAAARCNKGFEVLYTLAVDHFVQVAVRIRRGIQHGDACLSRVRRLLHCRLCEEWALHPEYKMLIAQPYSLLPCNCYDQSHGGTAIELGPAWFGNLYNADFVKRMLCVATDLNLSQKCQDLLRMMQEEALCSSSIVSHTGQIDGENTSKQAVSDLQGISNVPELIKSPALSVDKNVGFCTGSGDSQTESRAGSDCTIHQHGKRSHDSDNENSNNKKPHICRQYAPDETPYFYYNLHRRKLGNLPKSKKLVEMLRTQGYRASRTHFEPQGIRTSATLYQLQRVLSNQLQS